MKGGLDTSWLVSETARRQQPAAPATWGQAELEGK